MLNRAKIAALWTEAMSKPGAKQLNALGAALDDSIAIGGAQGKDAVLQWLKTWPGKSMFRTGTWGRASVDGERVIIECAFDEKAAYYKGILTLTIGDDGLITKSTCLAIAAPEPLGGVIHRVWGPRIGLDRLPDHLASTYGVTVKKVTPLDNGVLRVDRSEGGPWVVRVFPGDRPTSEVKGDAAVLSFLERQDYPAERVVEKVSSFENQGVLVTGFVAGKAAEATPRNVAAMADLLGRLHAMKGGGKATQRPGGGMHLYSPDASVRSEIGTALACLDAGAFRGTDRKHGEMREALLAADDFSDLPHALSHPDFHFKNVIATKQGPVAIDWAGVGQAPRVLALGLLLFYGSLIPGGWDPKRVDAMMDAYGAHLTPTASELDRLSEAMQHRMLIHEVYSWCVGMASRRKPSTMNEWPKNIKMCEAISERARTRS